ncbi:conserved protein, unknown function [Hepatocystis sp. ex Piliocolobus tephrosceles]|nr:conserved protein, unknown function [Hepatocystis sp. ex Piliocolobus tephrosceles]
MFLLNNEETISPKDILINELKYKIRIMSGVIFTIRMIPFILNLFKKDK